MSLLEASRKRYPRISTLIPITPEKISKTPITITPVNPEAPGSPTGPTLVNSPQKANTIEIIGRRPQNVPVPARR